MRSYWDDYSRSSASVGEPLRPPAEAIRFFESSAAMWAAAHRAVPLRGLLLGVTPEIATMRWPEESSLIAVEKSIEMAQTVWPGDVPGVRCVVNANWLALPCADESCNFVAGDGSINCVDYPDGFRAFAYSVAQVLRKNGAAVLRCYVSPDERERPDAVFAQALKGAIGSFHAFKLRLLMALQEGARSGVGVKDAYRAWMEWQLDLSELPSTPGWAPSAVASIALYREAATKYTFPTLAELRDALAPWFEEVSITRHGYELAERCPMLTLRRRDGP